VAGEKKGNRRNRRDRRAGDESNQSINERIHL
jgi:hypothetical protein